ncbi:putative exported phosphatase [Photobacterium sp. SKA34]|uniref:endonuclease/exonuclease/phosphatase family protein n=1 Tax=Photobacterium sp. SKA34 TaxID=121723 RepID=UPI00006AEE0F|nr:endonuclease/exonuclease/phosphatase family protein [Photobacterium sp. SKA34]EAR56204.1 putative exported phosphatase [Photobacterium sp. SKA34]
MKLSTIFIALSCTFSMHVNAFDLSLHNNSSRDNLTPYIDNSPDSSLGFLKVNEVRHFNNKTPFVVDSLSEGDIVPVSLWDPVNQEHINCGEIELKGSKSLFIENKEGYIVCKSDLKKEKTPNFTEISLLDFENNTPYFSLNDSQYVKGFHSARALRLSSLNDTLKIDSAKRVANNSLSFWFKPEKNELNNNETRILMTGPGFSLLVNEKGEIGISRQVTTHEEWGHVWYFEPVNKFFELALSEKWHQIGLTFDRHNVTLFIDGKFISKFRSPYVIDCKTDEFIYLGKQSLRMEDGTEKAYLPAKGAIDNLHIFQGKLSHEQMHVLFLGDLKKKYSPLAISRSLPSNGMKNIPFENVTLKWFPHKVINRVTNNTSYKIQISEDANFNDLIDEQVTTDTFYKPESLEPNTRYYWRVVINNEKQSSKSIVWSFKTARLKHKPDRLTVMEFNTLGKSASGTEVAPVHGSEYAAEIIRNNNADIISFQEGNNMCKTVAELLDYNFIKVPDSNRKYDPCLLSRYPIVGESYPAQGKNNNRISAHIELPDKEIIEFSILHPSSTNTGEKLVWDNTKTDDECIEAERSSRIDDLQLVMNILDSQSDIQNMFIAADLNSVSVLDFTEETRSIHNGRGAMEWPVTSMLRDYGWIDSYRKTHPDPLKDQGITFSHRHPFAAQGRIDYVFSRGEKFIPISSKVIFSHPAMWITDHNVLSTTYKVNKQN